MATEPTTLELLRSRLTDLEARQRSTGGAAEGGFWESFSGRASSPEREPSGRSTRSTAQGRRVAPHARPAPPPGGPWSGLALEDGDGLEGLDLRRLPRLDAAGYEQMVDDPSWIEATAVRGAARATCEAEADGRRARQEAVALEAAVGLGLTRHAEAELTAAAERVAHQRRVHEVTLVTIVSELVSRGIDPPDGLSRTDWLRSHDPSLTAAQAKAFVTVGAALAEARWARLRLLVASQQVTVGNAAQIVEFDARTTPVADPDDLVTALADLTDQAPQLRPEELARLVRHHTEQVRPPRDEDRLDRGRRDARGLWFTPPTATGMVGLRGMLDPEGAAVLKSAIDPLSIPCPEKDEHGRTITPDDRTPARRRMDALLTMVRRGVASADGVPTTDKAKVVVLVDLETLLSDLDPDIPEAFRRRSSSGCGTTLSGDVLSPGVVRRLACDAEIIPMVLGGDSEPLDVGRSRRLFTRGQRLALIARDKGCSFDGCTVPATWCDAHHVVHWLHGGRTCVTNAALLCQRHHTEVHTRDLTATVTATGVTWHT